MLFTFTYALYAALQGALGLWVFKMLRVEPREYRLSTIALMLPMVTVVWDNGVIAIGRFVGEGTLLEALTFPRFLGHSLFTPIWIPATVALAVRAVRSERKFWLNLAWGLYAAMVVVGLINEVFNFEGEIVREGDVLYYTNVGRLFTPPPPSLTMILVATLAGLFILVKRGWPWMLLGALSVTLSQSLGGDGIAFIFVNSAEVLMSLSLAVTLRWLQNAEWSRHGS